MKCQDKPKIIVILGPTASGKTKLAVRLAYRFNGEIISADSRQVYKGMDIGTGKDLGEYKVTRQKAEGRRQKGIPYYMIDVVEPSAEFNLAIYQKMAFGAIDDVLNRGKLPIIAGGSGLYLQAVLDGYAIPEIAPDDKFRKDLEGKTVEDLYESLLSFNKKFAQSLNNSDKNNKRRLIRYLEIGRKSETGSQKASPAYDPLIIGLKVDREVLYERIKQRIIDRLEKEDMVGEVQRLYDGGLSWKRLESFGLEYKFISYYLQEKLDYEEMVDRLNVASRQFAKRQLTWFKRWEGQGRKILWITKVQEAEKAVMQYIA